MQWLATALTTDDVCGAERGHSGDSDMSLIAAGGVHNLTVLIDPHIHQWDPYRTPRVVSGRARLMRPLPSYPGRLRRLLPMADREFIGDPSFVLKPYLPRDYEVDAKGLDVAAVVHIEAEWKVGKHADTVEETRWVAALPLTRPRLGGIVVHADPREPDVAAVLDAHLEASALVRGVRCSASHHPDQGVRSFTSEPHLLADPAFLRGFAAIAERGLTFDVWVYAHQLPDAVALAKEYPEVNFVLDHYATPVGVFGPRGRNTGRSADDRAAILARWRDDMAELAALQNVVAKHSGLGMPLLGYLPEQPVSLESRGRLAELAAPLITHTQELFGAARTMWASNFPIDKPVQDLPVSVEILRDVLGSDVDENALFCSNAERVYRIERES